ncbi:MAG: aldose 1-epimerase family protein [Nocardioidaceae bacterium]
MVAPSGEQYEIVGGGYRAVVTESGATLRELSHDGRPLVLGFAADASSASGRGQLLAPWPNRVRDGRYTFDGRDHRLPLSEPGRGHASHGLVRWAAWTVVEHHRDSVALTYRLMSQPGYPWTLDLHARYDVSEHGLTVTVTATNLAGTRAPYALGAHPYLTTGTGPVDRWELTLPAAARLVTDERLIPTGTEGVRDTALDFREGRVLGSTGLDTAFTDLSRGPDGGVEVSLRDPDRDEGVTLWMDSTHSWVQLFTGDELPVHARESLAVEPMTAPPNALATGTGLVLLSPAGGPDARHVASWGIRAH